MVLWNFDLILKKLWYYGKIWYYGKNYLTIPKTMDLGLTKGKNVGLPKTMKL